MDRLKLLALAGFASLVSMRVCDAMLPSLAEAFLVRPTEAASVISSFAIVYGCMQLFYGALGDRLGKLRVLTWATVLCTLAALAAALSPSLGLLTLSRAAMGAGAAAIVPLALAWIGDRVPMAQRQVVLSRYSGATIAGIMAGAWAGGFISQVAGWRWAFMGVAALFLFVSAALWRDLRSADATESPPAVQLPYWQRARDVLGSSWARTVLAAVCLEGACVFASIAFVPTALHMRFGTSGALGGAVLALFGLGGLVWSRAASPVLRRVPQHTLARVCGVLLGLGFGLLAWMPDWTWALAGCAVLGLGFYPLHSTLLVNASQLSDTSRGMAITFFGCLLFVGQSIGVAIAAPVFTQWSPAWFFGGAGLLMLLQGLFLGARLLQRG